jgi:hypothetical protein
MEVRARWLAPCYWHDDIGKSFLALMQDVDGLLPGRRTYVIHAEAVEPMLPGDPFGDAMNAPRCPNTTFALTSATPHPTGVVGLQYARHLVCT